MYTISERLGREIVSGVSVERRQLGRSGQDASRTWPRVCAMEERQGPSCVSLPYRTVVRSGAATPCCVVGVDTPQKHRRRRDCTTAP